MTFNNAFKRFALLAFTALFTLSFGACSDDNDIITDPDNPQGEFNPYVVSLAVQGSEGGFTYYTVPFKTIMDGTLNAVGQGIEQPGYYDFTQIGNTIYSIGGLDDVDMVGIRKNTSTHKLEKFGHVSFNTSVSDLRKADENTLIAVTMDTDLDLITFRKFAPNTMSITSEKTVATSALEPALDPNLGLSYSGMVISGNHLFLSYYISNPETFKTPKTDMARVAVFAYPSLEFQKVITDSRVGPIGGFNIKSGLIKDDNGNVYAISHSNPANGFSQSTKPSGILKINSGATTFDSEYFFDISAEANGGNTAHLSYIGNGKAFAEINTAARNTQEMWSDSPLKSAVIDLETQTVNFISGIPEHKGNGRRLPLLHKNNAVFLSIPDGNGLHIYKINTVDFTATQGAKVQANFVAGLFKL